MLRFLSVITLVAGQNRGWRKARSRHGPLVETENGNVEGITQKAKQDESAVDAFFGIPYAAAPTGSNRFRPPQPFSNSWAPKTRKAKKRGNTCPQLELASGLYYGHEDCLFINVYRPTGATNKSNLPVLLWIYGGGFFMGDSYNFVGNLGDGLYDGFNNVKLHEYVIVSFNYRLNALGFMALPELVAEDKDGSTGNYGTMDQRAAMQWVQRNIRAFGGDPNQVTIAGESAGGISVAWHLASPASRGLFHAAIIQSGAARNSWFLPKKTDALHFFDDWTATIGCNVTDRVACLRKLPTRKFMVSIAQWVKDWAHRFLHLSLPKDVPDFASPIWPVAPFAPVIDGTDVGLPDLPQTLFDRGDFAKVPLIVGGNQDDGAYFGPILPLTWGAFPETGYDLRKLLEWILPDAGDREKAHALYSGFDFPDDRKKFRRIFRDSLFACSTRDMSVAWSNAGVPVHTFVMSFDYKEWGILKTWGDAHALELVFTWRNGVDRWGGYRFDKQKYHSMEDLMACTWASFIWCQAPKCPTPPKHCDGALRGMPKWPSFITSNSSDMRYISLKEFPSVETVNATSTYGHDEFPGEDRCDFWRTANMDWQSIRQTVAKMSMKDQTVV